MRGNIPDPHPYPATSNACFRRSPNSTYSNADSCVDSSTTNAAFPANLASSHLSAQTHHRSPTFNPGKPYSGLGVVRSLPAL